MPTRNTAVEKVIQRELPGWKVVKTRPAPDTAEGGPARVQADAVSPGLAALQAKLARPAKASAKRAKPQKKAVSHAQFVTVAPTSEPDTIRKFHKVVLVKDGKVIAQQG